MARNETDPEPDTNETRRDWEVVQQDEGESKTERLRVRNGWLYRSTVEGVGVAMVFVSGE